MTRDLGKFVANGPNFKDKYLDEEDGPALARWFIFGVGRDGNVDIATPDGTDAFVNVPVKLANKLIELRGQFVTASIEAIREYARTTP